MKKDLHPAEYRPVVFQDSNADFAFLTQSTAKTKDTIKWADGNEYPLVKIHISSASHPFYTGEEKIVDVEGRVDRFKAKTEAAKQKRAALSNKAKKANAKLGKDSPEEAQKLGAKIDSKPKAEKKTKSKEAPKKAATKDKVTTGKTPVKEATKATDTETPAENTDQ